MAQFELILPKMGESVAEATVIKWEKNPGDEIEIDDIVLEVATDKVDSEVPSPVKGKLTKQFFQDGDVAQVGDVIALIETSAPAETTAPVSSVTEEQLVDEHIADITTEIPFVPQSEERAEAEESPESSKFYSPLVRSIAQEEGISNAELDAIEGSGAEGRVTKADLLSFIEEKRGGRPANALEKSEAVQQEPQAEKQAAQPAKPFVPAAASEGGEEVVEMDRMRKLIAGHMLNSKDVAAHVTSFVEADVTNLVQWRDRVKGGFEKRENEKITFTPVFIEAVTKAIKDFPMINISVNGTQIIKKKYINIGMATALPNGNLIVPVIKNADQLNLVGLAKSVNDLAKRARYNKLQPEEVQGGTFTISNIGGFGNIMGTPLINQPQVAILAFGVIKKKPAVIETEHGDMIGIRQMMYLSMSYDHRVVDGALGGMFLRRVADYLEQWNVNRTV